MTKNKNKIALKNGLFLGIAIIGASYALQAIDKFENGPVLLVFSSLLFSFSYLSILQGKKYYDNKSFRDSFSMGFKTTVISAVLVGVSTYIFFTFIDNQLLQNLIEQQKASILETTSQLKDDGTSFNEKEIQSIIDNMEQFLSPKSLGLKIGFFTIILGAITSLVTTTLSELIWMRNAKQ